MKPSTVWLPLREIEKPKVISEQLADYLSVLVLALPFVGKMALAGILLLLVSTASVAADEPGKLYSTFTQPALLGGSISVTVFIQNLSSITWKVNDVTVTFDWYRTYTGEAPIILQPGESHEWKFPECPIPKETWAGKHSFKSSAVIAAANPLGGWTDATPGGWTTDFAVQESPPPPPAYTHSEEALSLQVTQSTYTTDGSWTLPLLILILLLVVGIVAVRLRQPKPSLSPTSKPQVGRCPQCGWSNPPDNQFCGKCGHRLRE